MNLAEKYLIEALEAYPYNLSTAMEALDYVLSYDEENAMAYCLYGEIYTNYLSNPVKGIEYFEYALCLDPNTIRAYYPYILALISVEDYDKAMSVIEYALKVKGISKPYLWLYKALIAELKLEFNDAIDLLKVAKNSTVESEVISLLEATEARVKSKIPAEEKVEEKTEETPKSKLRVASWFGLW